MNENLKKGTRVRVKKPDDFMKSVSSKLANRTGEVTLVRGFDRGHVDYVVHFPKEGRRKPFTHHFYKRDLEVIE